MRNVDQDLFEQVQAQMEQPTFLERASERMWKCEGLFAESKQYHCLARAKYRGRSKVQIQAYLCAIVQNLKRLLFPLYCWLLAHCWSYSTITAPASPPSQSRPPTDC
jgi:Transposase DDE domain